MGKSYLDMYGQMNKLYDAIKLVDFCYIDKCNKCVFLDDNFRACGMDVVKKRAERLIRKLEKKIEGGIK